MWFLCAALPPFTQAASITISVTNNLKDTTDFEFAAPYLSSFGSQGTKQGEFDNLTDVVVDADGNIYVLDRLQHRVQKFDANGQFLRMWGKAVISFSGGFQICTAEDISNGIVSECREGRSGSSAGEMWSPRGIAIDSSNNIYVADSSNNRINKYSSEGAYIRTFSRDLYNADESAVLYQRLDTPVAVDVDPSGNIYIGESQKGRIVKLDSDGKFDRMWGWGVVNGSTTAYQVCLASNAVACSNLPRRGVGAGQLFTVTGLALDNSNNVLVSNLVGSPILKYSSSGVFLEDLVGQGSAVDQVAEATPVSVFY